MPPAAKKSTNTNRTHPYEKNSTAPDMASPTSPTARNNSSKAWNKEADDQLLQARKQGMNWEPIARKYFPSKTANACRKRHERLQEKLHHEEAWDPSKLEAMAMSYVQYREQIWKVVAERLDERWQDVESRCMEQGLKNLLNQGRPRNRHNDRRTPSVSLNIDNNNDSGLADCSYQTDPLSASSAAPSHSSRRASSSVSPLQHIFQPHQQFHQQYHQHQQQQSIPSIQSLLASTSGPMPNAMYATN